MHAHPSSSACLSRAPLSSRRLLEERALCNESWAPRSHEDVRLKAVALEMVDIINQSYCTCSEGANDDGTPTWLCCARGCYSTEATGPCDQATDIPVCDMVSMRPLKRAYTGRIGSRGHFCICMVCAWGPSAGGTRPNPYSARFKTGGGNLLAIPPDEFCESLSCSKLRIVVPPAGSEPAPYLRREARQVLQMEMAPTMERAKERRMLNAPEER
jgi:hypothetical protein